MKPNERTYPSHEVAAPEDEPPDLTLRDDGVGNLGSSDPCALTSLDKVAVPKDMPRGSGNAPTWGQLAQLIPDSRSSEQHGWFLLLTRAMNYRGLDETGYTNRLRHVLWHNIQAHYAKLNESIPLPPDDSGPPDQMPRGPSAGSVRIEQLRAQYDRLSGRSVTRT